MLTQEQLRELREAGHGDVSPGFGKLVDLLLDEHAALKRVAEAIAAADARLVSTDVGGVTHRRDCLCVHCEDMRNAIAALKDLP